MDFAGKRWHTLTWAEYRKPSNAGVPVGTVWMHDTLDGEGGCVFELDINRRHSGKGVELASWRFTDAMRNGGVPDRVAITWVDDVAEAHGVITALRASTPGAVMVTGREAGALV